MVQLSATPSSGAAATDANVARRFVRIILQCATGTATADCATRSRKYCDDGQGGELDADADATAASSSWGADAAPGHSDPSWTGELLLSRISAGYWCTLTLCLVIPIVNFLALFSMFIRCYRTGPVLFTFCFLMAHSFCSHV